MTNLKAAVKQLVTDALAELGASVPDDDVDRAIGKPRKAELGDVSFGVFPLAKPLKQAPPAIATQLAEAIQPRLASQPLIASVEVAGPYLNFRADHGAFARDVLPAAIAGRLIDDREGQGKTVVIDFSSPNVAKPFGIGHLRSTAIGAAIGRLFRARGYRVVGINHIGDWGTQFGKLISAWLRWGSEEALAADPIGHLYDLYVRFHQAEEADPNLTQEGRDWFRKLETGDATARELWKRFRDLSLGEFERIYRRMGVTFDHVWGEAYYEDKLPGTLRVLEDSGIMEESAGAKIVRVDEFYPNTSPCLIQRTDGATLYTTRDVASALFRWDQFHFERMLYVVGADQADHFRKLFGVLKRLGKPWAERCEHIPFGRIQGISTRKGTLVFLEDVLDRARDLSLEIMRDREMPPDEQLREAEKIGIGAVVLFDLSKERIKDAEFSWDAILQITGRTGPGLQYTQVRLKSLLAKYGEVHGELPAPEAVAHGQLREPALIELVQAISQYDEIVGRAMAAYEPAILTRYLLDLADTFNTFYSSGERIVSDDVALSGARTTLCRALLAVLLSGMAILGVPAPDRM